MIRYLHVIIFLLICFNCGAQPDSQNSTSPDSYGINVVNGTFLGNEQRNYYGNRAPEKLDVLWKHYLGEGETVISRKLGSRTWAGAGWTGQPLLVEEENGLFLIQGAYDHNLKKINASDGQIIWEYEFDDVIKGTGSIWYNSHATDPQNALVILQGSRLGIGNYLDTPHIPSYRAISYFSGKELWRLDVKWTDSYSRDADGSALILGDIAYIGLENSLFTVLDPDPASAEIKNGMLQPKIIQERKLYKPEDVSLHRNNIVTESSPSLLGDHIYIASGSGHVFGYNLQTRELDWDYYVGSDMDGSAIVTSDSCLLVSVEKQYIRGPGGALKLDPSKTPEEAVVWFQPVDDSTFSSWEGGIIGSIGISDQYRPGADIQYAAFVGIDGYLRVVDHLHTDSQRLVTGPDGQRSYHPPRLIFKAYVGPSISTPVFCNDKLIVAGYHGIRLYAIEDEGEFRLLDKLGPAFESTPVVHDGKVYIASRNGYLYCLGEAGSTVDY
jgi:outer membrane protein assembly factor BamB